MRTYLLTFLLFAPIAIFAAEPTPEQKKQNEILQRNEFKKMSQKDFQKQVHYKTNLCRLEAKDKKGKELNDFMFSCLSRYPFYSNVKENKTNASQKKN